LQRYIDIATALLALFAVLLVSNSEVIHGGLQGFLAIRVTIKNVLLLGTFCLAWVGSFSAVGLYEESAARDIRQYMARVVAACTIGALVVLLFPVSTHGTGALRYSGVGFFWLLVVVMTVAVRVGVLTTNRAIRQRAPKRIMIIGTGPRAIELARQLRSNRHETNEILGFVDTRDAAQFGDTADWNLGFLDELESTLMHTVVDEVLIALPIKSCYSEIETAIRACEHAGVQSKYLADVFDPLLARPRMETAGNFPLMAMRVVQDDYRLAVKRVLDLTCIAIALPVLIPLSIAIAAAVKLSSPGPVFFSHERYGRKKRVFRMHKFRTMQADAEALQSQLEAHNEADGPVFKIRDDPRVTRVGRFLRKTSLDELPQLYNVVKGQMSLVGPRPLSRRDVRQFTEAWLMRRFSVTPGLTCLWQISGRSNLTFYRWVELDLEYIDRWSLALDLEILARTLPAVVRGTGAS
jgi:exopolysaccharide biosynthesis polyprenyl glycosylphosphotransferase